MARKRNKKKHLKDVINTHLFEYCDWCEVCRPSSIAHFPVNIRSSSGKETYWICQFCLDNAYMETEKELKKHKRKVSNGNARKKTKKVTTKTKSKTKKEKK